jgi:hypothetical protein
MKFLLLYIPLVLLFVNPGVGQDYDSLIVVKESAYLENLVQKQGNIPYIFGQPNTIVQTKEKLFSVKPQIFLKTEKGLFLTFSGSGRLYLLEEKKDTQYYFKRIDNTENINYNLGAYYFFYQNQVYCFGGYGFWRTVGSLKYFNAKDKQWDILPLSEEIIPQFHPIEGSWFDQKAGKYYVPFQSIVNAGINGTDNLRGKIDPFSYVLNLEKRKWEKVGEASKELIEIITNGQAHFRSERGLIVVYYDKAYLIDFKANKILSTEDINFKQSLGRINQSDYNYEYNGYLYRLNNATKNIDSLKINYAAFYDTGGVIWQPIYNFTIPFTIAFCIVGLSAILFVIFRKKRISVNHGEIEQSFKIKFTDTELSLIQLLLEKFKKNERADINEVNYVLGLKHKNTGLQKKVRSDTFNSVNEKFKYISKTDEALIQSIRSETDKRYFEYFINEQYIDMLKPNID